MTGTLRPGENEKSMAYMQIFEYIATNRLRVAMTKTLISIVLLVLTGLSAPAKAAELIMLEQEGCAWCARWNAEIAPIYPKTVESRIAPLRRVDIRGDWPDDLDFVAPEVFTPTFVLVHEGREYGRLRGYAGDEFFWVLLSELLEKLPPEAKR